MLRNAGSLQSAINGLNRVQPVSTDLIIDKITSTRLTQLILFSIFPYAMSIKAETGEMIEA